MPPRSRTTSRTNSWPRPALPRGLGTGDTSAGLHIHRSTLSNRLRRIEERTGPRSPEATTARSPASPSGALSCGSRTDRMCAVRGDPVVQPASRCPAWTVSTALRVVKTVRQA
ncbi:helix-turn-helix domain-containing protein [Streptomyces sp. CoH17]|uniref:helix-turn-helix domain-containing protein n=1 Tax=Streptomyces sp. CoH17 TaxID=2992806 RepID=UPI003B635103